jgi:metal-sulfur cluster biosynthetic enzyme
MIKLEITDPHYDLKTSVVNALYDVVDPELGINIIDLGLVYDITVKEQEITVLMTLSTPSCPMGGMITAHARIAVEQAIAGYKVKVELIWEPRWNAEMVNEAGKAALGW